LPTWSHAADVPLVVLHQIEEPAVKADRHPLVAIPCRDVMTERVITIRNVLDEPLLHRDRGGRRQGGEAVAADRGSLVGRQPQALEFIGREVGHVTSS
jgi:hypothetical protein